MSIRMEIRMEIRMQTKIKRRKRTMMTKTKMERLKRRRAYKSIWMEST
jgi:hypothetical protein